MSLVTLLSGASIPVAVNAVTIAIGAVFWPCACLFLVRQVVGARAVGILAAGILSAAFAAFPYLMMDFGVLYPYLLAVSVLPAAFALVIGAAGLAREPAVGALPLWVALLGLLPGLALAHPSAVMALLALSVPIMLLVAYRQFTGLQRRRASALRRMLLVAGWAAAFLVMAVVWLWLPVGRHGGRGPRRCGALGELALNAPLGLPAAWALSVCHGDRCCASRPGSRPPLAGARVAHGGVPVLRRAGGAVFVFPQRHRRHLVQRPVPRGRLAPDGGASHRGARFPLAARCDVRWAGPEKPTRAPRRRIRRAAHGAAGGDPALERQRGDGQAAENYSAHRKIGPADPRRNGAPGARRRHRSARRDRGREPWTGTSLVYALADRPALLPHVGGFDTAQTRVITEHLRDAEQRSGGVSAVRALNVGFVLDFGRHEVHHKRHVLPGLENLASSDAVQLVDEQGAAKLYKITACG